MTSRSCIMVTRPRSAWSANKEMAHDQLTRLRSSSFIQRHALTISFSSRMDKCFFCVVITVSVDEKYLHLLCQWTLKKGMAGATSELLPSCPSFVFLWHTRTPPPPPPHTHTHTPPPHTHTETHTHTHTHTHRKYRFNRSNPVEGKGTFVTHYVSSIFRPCLTHTHTSLFSSVRMAVNGPLTLVVIFFALCLLLPMFLVTRSRSFWLKV